MTEKSQNQTKTIIGLIVALMVVLLGAMLFVGAVSGWFDDPKINLDAEYYTENPELIDIDAATYDDLIKARKSFVLFIDQDNCVTADRLKGYIDAYSKEAGVIVYRMAFSEVKNSTLGEHIKYYPSFVVISRGQVKGFLRADSDEDAAAYNSYDDFRIWVQKYL